MSRARHKSGGEAGFGSPRDDEAAEKKSKPQRYNQAPKVMDAAEEKKRGGRTKKRGGGGISEHHEKGADKKHAAHLGEISGESHAHKGRAPRARGGRSGSNFSPLSSAHSGTNPRGHSAKDIS